MNGDVLLSGCETPNSLVSVLNHGRPCDHRALGVASLGLLTPPLCMVAAPGAWEALQKTRKLRRPLSGHRSHGPMTFFSLSQAWGWANCGAHESTALLTHEVPSRIDWTAPIAKPIGSARLGLWNGNRFVWLYSFLYGLLITVVRCSRLCYAPRKFKQWAWVTGGLGSGVRVATPRITFLCCRALSIS